jgi:hypothetical protein
MRTTVTLEPKIARILAPLASTKRLSRFINECIREHLERKEKERVRKRLASSYTRANKDIEGFEKIDIEGWPEW